MDIAMWAGKERQWIAILERAQEMIVKWPALQAGIDAHYSILADFPEEDYRRVFLMADWLFANPNSGLYPRQLPVAGVDSKWLEGRKGTIARLVTAIRGDINDTDFYRVCGLKPLPKSMRIRLLDPALRQRCGGLGDITAPIEEIAQLDIGIDMVLILENLQTGLALGDLPGTAAIMGLGYGVDVLSRLPWVMAARKAVYWGDLDTHGFAILSCPYSCAAAEFHPNGRGDSTKAPLTLGSRRPAACRAGI
jgi:hypothetical protein